MLVLSTYSPTDILLIDFRETASRRADEVTNLAKAAPSESQISLFPLVWFVVLSADEGGRMEVFNYSEKVKKVVEVCRNTTLAGCYVDIAPIWNVIKLVWLLASGKKKTKKNHSFFFSFQK